MSANDRREPPDRQSVAPNPAADRQDAARKPREYGHSSGDRNTRTSEDDWHGFKGGDQREAGPDDAAAQGGERPPRRHS